MKLIATVSDATRVGVVVDLDTATVVDIPAQPQFFDEAVRNRPSFRPFGISWFGNQCFIANNRQLIVFDRSLNFKIIDDTMLQGNVHQLASGKGRIWAVSPLWKKSPEGVCIASAWPEGLVL